MSREESSEKGKEATGGDRQGAAPGPATRSPPAGTGPGGGGSVGEFTVHGIVSPLVGRAAELGVLNGALERAIALHAPQIVTILGNQGTGKSRLVAEWTLDVEAPVRVLRGRPGGPGTRYSAIARLLRDRFGLPEGEDPGAGRERFVAGVQAVFGDRQVDEVIHFLGRYVGLKFAESPFVRAFDLDSPQHDEIARTMLRSFLETDAAGSPLVILIDDLHKADDDTLQLLGELAEGLAGSPVVFVLCARPDLLVRRPRWGQGNAEHIRIDLRNLDAPSAAGLVRRLLARCDRVPSELVEDAVAMTGGNPFFLEQLVRVMVANGTIDTSGPRWRVDAERAAEVELPLSVEEAIEARIAVLEREEVQLLERGATFGNVFWVGGLVALARNDRGAAAGPVAPAPGGEGAPAQAGWPDDGLLERLLAHIDGLVERDYLLRLAPGDSSIPGDIEVMFKHNLEREQVARQIDTERRHRYAILAAQWLETRLGDRSEEQLEFLAQLYERGGERRRAARCYLAAGDATRARFANEQAVQHYARGLVLLREDDIRLRLDALHNLGDVLALVGATDDAHVRFREMLETAWRFDFRAKGGAANGRIGRLHRQRGELQKALEHFRLAHTLFQQAADRRGVAGALDDAGQVYWLVGAYPTALECLTRALEIRRELGDRRSIALSLANLGLVERDLGAFGAAVEHLREAMGIRREIGDRRGVVSSLRDLGTVHAADGKLEQALEILTEALGTAREVGDRRAQATVLGHLSQVELEMGRLSAAADHVREAQETSQHLGDRIGQAEIARRVAEVCVALGRRREAEQEAHKALDLAARVGSRPHAAAAERLLGEVTGAFAATAAEQEEAERHFQRAIEILTSLRNDLELARCYRAFAAFRERCGLHASAAELRRRADGVFARLRGVAAVPS